MSRQVLFTLALLALTACTVTAASQDESQRRPGLLKVGEKVETNLVFAQGVEHSEIITAPMATYIAVHFSDYKLNTGDIVIVRSPDAKTAFTYGAEGVYGQSSFVADLVPGESAVIEYFPVSTSAASRQAFRINAYSRGVSLSANQEAVCGTDDMMQMKCFAPNQFLTPLRPLAYERGLAVARLLVEGSHACTGWLVGSAGHLMTNAHCVEDEAMANRMHVEFAAESGSCAQKCEDWLACKGQKVTLTTKLVARNRDHDYAVLKLPDDVDLWPYGFLTLRKEGAAVNEEIYVPNHSRAWGKRIAFMEDGKMIKVDSFGPSGQCAQNGLHFTGDIQGGASGSPAIGASDNKVVGIVSCGGWCPGKDIAEDIRLIIADLERKGVVIPDAY
ncbi:hypothetical protein P43SY_004034 [Pythium insidiosum]|uniref:Serine protease n=1 Tax=Pythium insidiosum TaxID=114742 RepID=A0AAD5M7G3_PYTIN|nr:hypothetical protein P43SY_004034 [Pythium insidiosum]